MKIGVDIDGFLTDLFSYQIKYGKEYFKNYNNYDDTKISISEIFHCTKEEEQKFWTKHIWKYCLMVPARANAAATLRKLKEDGNEIYIITSRAHVTENNIIGEIFRKMLFKWLKDQNIEYDGIVLCNEKQSDLDKYLACKELGIEVMCDDDVINIKAVKTIAKVISINEKYNENYADKNLIKMKNIVELSDVISELNIQKKYGKVI